MEKERKLFLSFCAGEKSAANARGEDIVSSVGTLFLFSLFVLRDAFAFFPGSRYFEKRAGVKMGHICLNR